MKIERLKVANFRTLEDIELNFTSAYSAICGPNDSGKTNVVRALRMLVRDEEPLRVLGIDDEQEISIKNDFPKFKEPDSGIKEIVLTVALAIRKDKDAGLHQAITKQLSVPDGRKELAVSITVTHKHGRPEPEVTVEADGQSFSGIVAQEVLKRLQTSRGVLFHNSTQIDSDLPFRSSLGGHIRATSPDQESLVSSMKRTVNKGLSKLSKSHKRELETLLGRLTTKYSVGLSMPAFDFSAVPFRVTLGQKDFEVPLDDWGSGTKNRTLILLRLFRAKQMSEADASANKITPLIVIEEPESFLHPSAQAEFGTVLQDIAEEFGVQVIVTTHSPYLLNLRDPAANVLLCRKTHYSQLRQTERIDTSGENWMKPFSLALGLESEEFRPWKNLILAHTDALLLVEGNTDKDYFEMLRDAAHGTNRLVFDGEIVSYDGTGSLQNTVLLRFIKNRCTRMFVTFDLDAESKVEKTLTSLGLEKKKHYCAVGQNCAGKRNIEGLLPAAVTTAVYGANADLVQQATAGTKEEQDSAKSKLKSLLLEEFKRTAKPGAEYFAGFYQLVRLLNKALG
jgi:energy-coupling factor transporter ATP-binding protein EcfA2